MSYFARKVKEQRHESETSSTFIALVELTKRKGKLGTFVLHYQMIQHRSLGESFIKMIRFRAATVAAAIEKFWPSDREGLGAFPRFDSGEWEKTTNWLAAATIEYSHKQSSSGMYVKVGAPGLWKKRRKKKPFQVGNISHMLVLQQRRLSDLQEEKRRLLRSLDMLKKYDSVSSSYIPEENKLEQERLSKLIDKVCLDIVSCETSIVVTKAEIRYKVHNMFPKEKLKEYGFKILLY